jgi:hypothetical protein
MQTATVTRRRSKSSESPQEALARIQSMQFGRNDLLVITAFSEAGIPPEQVDPRHNVLTFNAWKALGRRVAKGAKSIGVTVWIPINGKKDEPQAETDDDGEAKKKQGMRPKLTRLFHEWQTVPVDAEKGTRPEAWNNPALVREGTYEPVDDSSDPCKPAEVVATDDSAQPAKVEVVRDTYLPMWATKVNGVTTDVSKTKREADTRAADWDKRSAREREAAGIVTNSDEPEQGKKYSLAEIASGKNWAESEVTA